MTHLHGFHAQGFTRRHFEALLRQGREGETSTAVTNAAMAMAAMESLVVLQLNTAPPTDLSTANDNENHSGNDTEAVRLRGRGIVATVVQVEEPWLPTHTQSMLARVQAAMWRDH